MTAARSARADFDSQIVGDRGGPIGVAASSHRLTQELIGSALAAAAELGLAAGLNVQRIAGNFIGVRLVLALAAGAAVVTEPMADPFPFVPGVHYVEAPPENLVDEARSLLADERRRRRIVEAGQELLAGELAMTRSLTRVLALLEATPDGSPA